MASIRVKSNPNPTPTMHGTTLQHEELHATAGMLYDRMGDNSFGSDDLYWASLPTHLRNFIRNALPLAGHLSHTKNRSEILPGGVQFAGGQTAMYRLAQDIVGSANRGHQDPSISRERGPVDLEARCAPVQRGSETILPSRAATSSDEPSDMKTETKHSDDGLYQALEQHGNSPPTSRKSGSELVATRKNVDSLASPQQQSGCRAPQAIPDRQTSGRSPNLASTVGHQHRLSGTATQATPSSRAAGKKPMQSHIPTSNVTEPVAQTNGLANRSMRSAGKAPLVQSTNPSAPTPTPSQGDLTAKATVPGPGKAKVLPSVAATTRDWRITTADEREEVRDYWMRLDHLSQRRFILAENNDVARRIKEYQRHACACGVCGRKRAAIEAEIRSLYQVYGDSLVSSSDQNASTDQENLEVHQRAHCAGPFLGSVEVDAQGTILKADYLAPISRQRVEETEDESLHSDDYEDDEDEDEYDDDEEEDIADEDDIGQFEADRTGEDHDDNYPRNGGHKPARHSQFGGQDEVKTQQHHIAHPDSDQDSDFPTFDGSLTTIKGVLTVADDLLKGEGQGFLQMMEQLAERREGFVSSSSWPSTHRETAVPLLDCVPQEAPTQDLDRDPNASGVETDLLLKRRMAEGSRLFQVFAARLLEQRVLQAYREEVAQNKQLQFLRELEEEESAAEARDARKAKEAQKKKDKRRQQRQAKEDERLRKEAAAEAEAELVKARRRDAEALASKRREDERLRKEVERKARVDELALKERARRQRQAEDREKEAERARKRDKLAVSRESSISHAQTPAATPFQVENLTERAEAGRAGHLLDGTTTKASPPPDNLIVISTAPSAAADPRQGPEAFRSRPSAMLHSPASGCPYGDEVQTRQAISVSLPAGSSSSARMDPVVAESALRGVFTPDETLLLASTTTSDLRLPAEASKAGTIEDYSGPGGIRGSARRSSLNAALPSPPTKYVQSSPYGSRLIFDRERAADFREMRSQPNAFLPSPVQESTLQPRPHLPVALVASDPRVLRPEPIGPIEPIGRPRQVGISDYPHNSVSVALDNEAIPKERVLGSAALSLGTDDEVVVAPPRRLSTFQGAIRQSWNRANVSGVQSSSWPHVQAMGSADIWSQPVPGRWTSTTVPARSVHKP